MESFTYKGSLLGTSIYKSEMEAKGGGEECGGANQNKENKT